jgi:hypothetical protein
VVESASKEGSNVGMKEGRKKRMKRSYERTNEGWMNGRQNCGTYMKGQNKVLSFICHTAVNIITV